MTVTCARLKKFVDYLNDVNTPWKNFIRRGALNLNVENVNQTVPES